MAGKRAIKVLQTGRVRSKHEMMPKRKPNQEPWT